MHVRFQKNGSVESKSTHLKAKGSRKDASISVCRDVACCRNGDASRACMPVNNNMPVAESDDAEEFSTEGGDRMKLVLASVPMPEVIRKI